MEDVKAQHADAAPQTLSAAGSGEFRIAGTRPIHRLGFGAMRITGKGIWGEPKDRDAAIRVLRRAVELGVNFIDTADSYGPEVSERIIAEALYPYPSDLLIATKAGFDRTGPDRWVENGRPDHLRAACEGSLKRLRLDCIELFQLHRFDPRVPAADQIGALRDLREQGKIRHIGLSQVSVAQIEHARAAIPVATVQNRYSVLDRSSDGVLDYCQREKIGFIPWFPLGAGRLAARGGALERTAAELKIAPSQLALAWLLWRSPVVLPIPGTSRVEHLEENIAAASLRLDAKTLQALAS